MVRATTIWLPIALLSASSASAETITLAGFRGIGTVEVRDAELYLADPTFVVLVEQTQRNGNIGVIVRSSPAVAIWRGGTVVGIGVNRTASWDEIYHRLPGAGNGACLIVKDSPDITVERLRCDWTWDGFRTEGGAPVVWTLRQSWFSNNRDDGVENDRCNDGLIERSLIENAMVGYSARPGDKSWPCSHTLVVMNSMISLGRHYDDLEKRRRPWSNIEGGRMMQSGVLWKVSGTGSGTKVLLKDSIIKLDHVPGVAIRELRLVPEGWEIMPESGNNTFVWIGVNDLPGLTYETINGCRVPKEFKVPQQLFRVVCGAEGQELWDTARVALMAEIQPPPPPPPPDPPPDPIILFLEDLRGQTDVLRGKIDELLKQRMEPDG